MKPDFTKLYIGVFQPIYLPWEAGIELSLKGLGDLPRTSSNQQIDRSANPWKPERLPEEYNEPLSRVWFCDEVIAELDVVTMEKAVGFGLHGIKITGNPRVVLLPHGCPQLVWWWQADHDAGKIVADQELFDQVIYSVSQQSTLATSIRTWASKHLWDWINEVFDKESVQGIDPHQFFPPHKDHLVLVSSPGAIDWGKIHLKYETTEQMLQSPQICHLKSHEEIHFGWGYTTLTTADAEKIAECSRLVGFAQAIWYQVRLFRKLVLAELETMVRREPISDRPNKDFDRLSLAYEKLFLTHANFRSGLRPKWFEAFSFIENAWHMQEDFRIFRETYERAANTCRRRTREREEKVAKQQSNSLVLISVLQIFALISVACDYLSLVWSEKLDASGVLDASRPFWSWILVYLPIGLAIASALVIGRFWHLNRVLKGRG
jgi:hypothetical protein